MKTKLLSVLAGLSMSLCVALMAFAPVASFALTVDQSRIMNKRFDGSYNPNYYRVTINFNDQNIGSGQAFGALGKASYIHSVDCYVSTAFNAGTTNVITFGTSAASANEIVASGITAATPGVYHLTSAAGLGLAATASSDTTLYAKYAQTGTAATTGSVTCVIQFIPNNDM